MDFSLNEEQRLLDDQYTFAELDGMAEDERSILLDSAALLFLGPASRRRAFFALVLGRDVAAPRSEELGPVADDGLR